MAEVAQAQRTEQEVSEATARQQQEAAARRTDAEVLARGRRNRAAQPLGDPDATSRAASETSALASPHPPITNRGISATRLLAIALLIGPLLGVGGYIIYDQREKALRREYHEAVAAYRSYLVAERMKDENEDSAFAIKAGEAERAARATGGLHGQEGARIQNFYANERRKMEREMRRIQQQLNGPPPPEWVRFQKAARAAGMPSTLEDAP